jgi:hypothetical protein
MPELEHALRQLGGMVEFPPEPDLAAGVRRRLGEAPSRRWAPRRIALVALAVLVVAVGAALAVPSARTAVLEWLGIKGVKVTRVETLPKVSLLNEFGLGERVSLAEARRRAPWLVEPQLDSLDPPDQIYYSSSVPHGQVSFLWGSKTEVQLLMTQATGEVFAEKMLGPGTDVERANVDGRPGVWLTGDPHVFLYRDSRGNIRQETARLARNTLLWQHDELTVRLEGELSKGEALEIARSVRS